MNQFYLKSELYINLIITTSINPSWCIPEWTLNQIIMPILWSKDASWFACV